METENFLMIGGMPQQYHNFGRNGIFQCINLH